MNGSPSLFSRLLGWVFLLTLIALLGFGTTVGPILPPPDEPFSPVETSLPTYDIAVPTMDEPDTTAAILTHGSGSRVGVSAPAWGSSTAPGGVIYHVNTTQQVLAFTFDLDMTPGMLLQLQSGRVHAWYDPEVVHILEQQNMQ